MVEMVKQIARLSKGNRVFLKERGGQEEEIVTSPGCFGGRFSREETYDR
jgi:hypothetical protein